jgi:hypothetical protein
MASMPFLSCKFFALQKTYETIVTGLHAGLWLSPWEFHGVFILCFPCKPWFFSSVCGGHKKAPDNVRG